MIIEIMKIQIYYFTFEKVFSNSTQYMKYINRILFCFVITIISMTLLNCNRCETNECTNGNTPYRISKVEKDYFYFKTGSWWVYENELSQEQDSMYVTESNIERIMGDEACDCEESLFIRCGTSLDDSLFFNTISSGSKYLYFTRKNLGSSFIELTFRFQVLNDSALSLTNQHNAIISYLPSYKVLNEEFKNVYRCFYNRALTDFYSDSYFASGIGLIRFTYKDGDGTYWNLIRYHVIQ